MATKDRVLVIVALCLSVPLLLWAIRARPFASDGQKFSSHSEVGEPPMQLHASSAGPITSNPQYASCRRHHGRRHSLHCSKLEFMQDTILSLLQRSLVETPQLPHGDPDSLENEEPLSPKGPEERIVRNPEQAYLAVCLGVKDQHLDLREWIEYHQRLGVGKFYIFDDNSSVPVSEELQDLIKEGLVESEAVGPLPEDTARPQMLVYARCIQRYREKHQWIAFIDVDEFLVLRDTTVTSLPQLLQNFTEHGALAVNWQVFGSSGHASRPEGSTLASYMACFPENDLDNRHVKSIVNMDHVYQTGGPHHFNYYAGRYAVNSAGEKVLGAVASRVVTDTIVLNHYVTKSLEEFQRKMERGSGMRNKRDMDFFQLVELMASQACTYAVHLGKQQQTPSV